MVVKVFLLMVLCHIIDDFVLQPICLSKLKQKEAWKDYDEMYKNDYKMALAMHSISWSIMITLPLIFLCGLSGIPLATLVIFNACVHYSVDDSKANIMSINLVEDQVLHLSQILVTLILCISLGIV